MLSKRQRTAALPHLRMRQHTSAYVSMRQRMRKEATHSSSAALTHASAYVSIR